MINGGLATVYVSDMDRAVNFYSETLGLKLQYRAGPGWAQLDAGKGLILGLHGTHQGGPPPGQNGSTVLGFELDEPMDQAYQKLASAASRSTARSRIPSTYGWPTSATRTATTSTCPKQSSPAYSRYVAT